MIIGDSGKGDRKGSPLQKRLPERQKLWADTDVCRLKIMCKCYNYDND
jgi:hypothetical protein